MRLRRRKPKSVREVTPEAGFTPCSRSENREYWASVTPETRSILRRQYRILRPSHGRDHARMDIETTVMTVMIEKLTC